MEPLRDESISLWLRNILREEKHVDGFLDALGLQGPNVVTGLARPKVPADKLPYLRQLITTLLRGREIVSYYNHVLLALLAVFTAFHIKEKIRCRRRSQQSASGADDTRTRPDVKDCGEYTDDVAVVTSSSSSTSSSGVVTPSGRLKDADVDVERLPLLGWRRSHGKTTIWTRTNRLSSKFLAYQPQNLPVVNRVLPSNSTSLFISLWFAINLFIHLYQLPSIHDFFFCFASRAGDVFIVNLPLLYLLAAKNQPLKLLTGRSYEALNIFHRRVGEWMCFEAFVHAAGMVLWEFALEPDWLNRGSRSNAWAYFSHPLVYYGLGAFLAYELLFFTSLGSFRRRWYEVFLASHVVLQVLALAFLYLHFHTTRPWVGAALAIFVVDRIVWRLGLKSAHVDATLKVLPDGQTVWLSAAWGRPDQQQSWRQRFRPKKDVRYGWRPTDHVFLTAPALGRVHMLQAHPFTIASRAPPPPPASSPAHRSSRVDADADADGVMARVTRPQLRLDLLIRAHGGFTADLVRHAHQHKTLRVRLDGPYGSSHAVDMLRAADNAVLVAGGSGIAVTLPLAWSLLLGSQRGPPSSRARGGVGHVRMLWVIHSEEHRRWAPGRDVDELVAAGLELVIPVPTSVGGRPDVAGILEGWVGGHYSDYESAVVVSGPDGLNRTARNLCAEMMGRGANIRLAVEKFGW